MLHSCIKEALDRGNIVIVPLAPQPNQLTRWKILLANEGMGNAIAYPGPEQGRITRWKVCQLFQSAISSPLIVVLGARRQRVELFGKGPPRSTVSLLQIPHELYGRQRIGQNGMDRKTRGARNYVVLPRALRGGLDVKSTCEAGIGLLPS